MKFLFIILFIFLSACSSYTQEDYASSYVAEAVSYHQCSGASWYGNQFHGRRTASGEIFNQNAMTAAHRSLPFGTIVRVVHSRTGNEVIVKVNDRGPFHGNRVIDLSRQAASQLGMINSGTAQVCLQIMK